MNPTSLLIIPREHGFDLLVQHNEHQARCHVDSMDESWEWIQFWMSQVMSPTYGERIARGERPIFEVPVQS